MRLIDGDTLMEIYEDRFEKLAIRYGFNSECGVLSGAMKLLAVQQTIDYVPIPYIYKVRNPFTNQLGYVTRLVDDVWCNIVWEDGYTESYKHISKVEVIE